MFHLNAKQEPFPWEQVILPWKGWWDTCRFHKTTCLERDRPFQPNGRRANSRIVTTFPTPNHGCLIRRPPLVLTYFAHRFPGFITTRDMILQVLAEVCVWAGF